MNRPFLLIAISAILLVPTLAAGADSALRASLFNEVDQLLDEARNARAELLAPRNFGRAIEAYRDAEERLERGQSIARIREDVTIAGGYLRDALNAATRASAGLTATLKARDDALSSGARTNAPEQFRASEDDLLKLAEELERGRNRDLRQFDQRLAGAYRAAELAAIKKVLLADTRLLLEQARELRADRYAPKTLTRAQTLLAEAGAALDEDRYDADRPRSLARAADIEARHAIYLVRQINEIRADRLSIEELILEWEQSIVRAATAADLAANFHEGPDPVATQLVDYITQRQDEIASLRNALSDREQQLAQMDIEIQDLEKRLGGVARERSALEEELSRQAQLRERYSQIESMFNDEEAVVVRESGKITLRLVGLKFAVGEADISASNFPLLAKVSSAIRIFPRARLLVEGHTDSFGSDQKNLDLSQERADAVRQYLLVSMRLNPAQISALGYGEARPMANNETTEGRARNRRIELVMFTDEQI